jgi:hypothetical protein
MRLCCLTDGRGAKTARRRTAALEPVAGQEIPYNGLFSKKTGEDKYRRARHQQIGEMRYCQKLCGGMAVSGVVGRSAVRVRVCNYLSVHNMSVYKHGDARQITHEKHHQKRCNYVPFIFSNITHISYPKGRTKVVIIS